MSNTMVITNVGLTEAANASAGGYLVNITSFKIGSGVTPPVASNTDLENIILSSSNITNIQVATNATAVEFTLFLDNNLSGISSNITITEVGIYLPSGVMFARGIFDFAVTKPLGVGIQIIAVIAATTCDLSVINATISNVTSIPSVPYVRSLADPSTGLHNAVAVLDQQLNSIGQKHAGLALKYGAGGNRWSFVGYDLVYEGNVDSLGFSTTPSIFKVVALSSANTFLNDEKFICQAISGGGAGQTRRIKYNESLDLFEECENKSFSPSLISTGSNSSKICIWRAIDNIGATGASPWPTLPLTNPDYVLTVYGVDGPKWMPIPTSNGNDSSSVSLYHPPSSLIFKSYTWTSNGRETSFSIPAFSLTSSSSKPPEDICYTFVTVQGILQTRQSYELIRREYSIPPSNNKLYESVILFSETPPIGSEIELWYAYSDLDTLTTNPGARTIAKTFRLGVNLIIEGDRKFYLQGTNGSPATDIPDNSDCLFVSIGGIKQFNNTFVYVNNASPSAYIEFNEKPPTGVPIEVTTLLQKSIPGTSETTKLINNDFFSYDNDITDIELSEIPTVANTGESCNSYIFVNVSGIYIHRDKYTVIGNRVLFSNVIAKRRAISVTIIKNITITGTKTTNITGMVTDGLVSSDYLYLLRHNALPVRVPLHRPNIKAGDGINILGVYPDITISVNKSGQNSTQRTPIKISNIHTQEDVEEIIYTYRLSYLDNIVSFLSCDFSARLGPGFMSIHGREYIEYSIGVRSGAGREPVYGRRIKGTGEAGFCFLGKEADFAYSNASISDIFEFIPEPNSNGGFVDIVARMRVLNATISEIHSNLSVNFNLVTFRIE